MYQDFNMIEIQCVSLCVLSSRRHLEMIYLLIDRSLQFIFMILSFIYMNFFVSFKAVWRVIWLFTFIASNCICLKWASVCSLLMLSLSNASLHSQHPISQACYTNLFVSFKTVCFIKWLFTFIASKLSLTKMVFCVFFMTVEAVKFLLTLIASPFSSLSYIHMNLFVSFGTVWGVKWLFAFIAPKV